MIIEGNFKPAWWLPSSHMQTVWPALVNRDHQLSVRRERLELSDGDFLDLDWVGEGDGPIIIVLHGLAGSIESHYAKAILAQIKKAGWRGVLMHFRGCSGEPNRLSRFYHSGETGDLNYVVNTLRQREPNVPLSAIGYSLGGNVLLKWLAETGSQSILDCATAVSVPFELGKAANYMSSGLSRMYQRWLLNQLREHIEIKFQKMEAPFKLEQVKDCQDFWSFDDLITAPLHGFRSAEHYYQYASARQYLNAIRVPTLILHATDDPFMPNDVIPTNHELSSSITLELCRGGGHVGFITGAYPGDAQYWLEKRIPDFIKQFYPNIGFS